MNPFHFLRTRSVLALMASALLSGTCLADSFPSKPLRIYVPNPPGGGGDTIARLVGSKLAERLGQTVVVENKPGGSSVISTDAAAKAEPDGHTLAFITDTHSINPVANANLPYDSIRDFAPVAQLIRGDYILVASHKSGIRDLQDLITKAKAQPGRYSYGSTGIGSVHHLAMELMSHKAGIKLSHVPYKGVSQAMADVLPGHIDLVLSGTAGGVVPAVAAGKLVGLGVTGSSRVAAVPDVPTFAQAGLPQFDSSFWFGFVAPAKTPPAIVDRLNREIIAVLKSDEVSEKLAGYGMKAAPPLSPAEFRQFMIEDAKRYKDLIESTGTKLD